MNKSIDIAEKLMKNPLIEVDKEETVKWKKIWRTEKEKIVKLYIKRFLYYFCFISIITAIMCMINKDYIIFMVASILVMLMAIVFYYCYNLIGIKDLMDNSKIVMKKGILYIDESTDYVITKARYSDGTEIIECNNLECDVYLGKKNPEAFVTIIRIEGKRACMLAECTSEA